MSLLAYKVVMASMVSNRIVALRMLSPPPLLPLLPETSSIPEGPKYVGGGAEPAMIALISIVICSLWFDIRAKRPYHYYRQTPRHGHCQFNFLNIGQPCPSGCILLSAGNSIQLHPHTSSRVVWVRNRPFNGQSKIQRIFSERLPVAMPVTSTPDRRKYR